MLWKGAALGITKVSPEAGSRPQDLRQFRRFTNQSAHQDAQLGSALSEMP
jgi:hypothetical protein